MTNAIKALQDSKHEGRYVLLCVYLINKPATLQEIAEDMEDLDARVLSLLRMKKRSYFQYKRLSVLLNDMERNGILIKVDSESKRHGYRGRWGVNPELLRAFFSAHSPYLTESSLDQLLAYIAGDQPMDAISRFKRFDVTAFVAYILIRMKSLKECASMVQEINMSGQIWGDGYSLWAHIEKKEKKKSSVGKLYSLLQQKEGTRKLLERLDEIVKKKYQNLSRLVHAYALNKQILSWPFAKRIDQDSLKFFLYGDYSEYMVKENKFPAKGDAKITIDGSQSGVIGIAQPAAFYAEVLNNFDRAARDGALVGFLDEVVIDSIQNFLLSRAVDSTGQRMAA